VLDGLPISRRLRSAGSGSFRSTRCRCLGWTVDPRLLKNAHNIGEAEAIQRHVLKGEPVSWCHQGYAWVDQDAIGWFYLAAFVFVVLPYLVIKIRTLRLRLGSGNTPRRLPEASSRLPS
jgi:hypothetical protein